MAILFCRKVEAINEKMLVWPVAFGAFLRFAPWGPPDLRGAPAFLEAPREAGLEEDAFRPCDALAPATLPDDLEGLEVRLRAVRRVELCWRLEEPREPDAARWDPEDERLRPPDAERDDEPMLRAVVLCVAGLFDEDRDPRDL